MELAHHSPEVARRAGGGGPSVELNARLSRMILEASSDAHREMFSHSVPLRLIAYWMVVLVTVLCLLVGLYPLPLGVIVTITAVQTVVLLGCRGWASSRRIAAGYFGFEILSVTAIAWLVGDLRLVAAPSFYTFMIMNPGIRLGRLGHFVIGNMTGAAFLAFVLLEHAGVIQLGWVGLGRVLPWINSVSIFATFASVNLAAVFASEARRTEDQLVATNAYLAHAYDELRTAQTRLLHSERMAWLGQLVAGVAHEINTPVTAVVANMKPISQELARLQDRAAIHSDGVLGQIAGRMQTIFEVMARGAERTARIVQDLRVFSRVGESQPLPMDIHEGLDVSLRLLRPRWADRIHVSTEYGAMPVVEASASAINQVFMNLLANACDAIDATGHICIRTWCDRTTASVAIRDDGAGIEAEHLNHIFDPFFTTKPVGKGTGLGLAISASIVRDHGGTIQVESAPGQGSTFTVILPLHAKHETLATRGPEYPDSVAP